MTPDQIIDYCLRTGSSLLELKNLLRSCVKLSKADEDFCWKSLASIRQMIPPQPMFKDITSAKVAA